RFDLGFNASFNPSPIKLMDKIVNVIAVAGGTHIQVILRKTSASLASANIFPQLGVFVGPPNPKKLRPDCATIITANINVACTIIVEDTFGIRCLTIIFDGLVPIDFAARIYSFSFSANTLLRTIRATPPQLNKLITIIRVHAPDTLPTRIEFNT